MSGRMVAVWPRNARVPWAARPRERKVRTPQSSVPDNVRDVGFKPNGRKVPQKTYRLWFRPGVRVKRCGKSAPPGQQCTGQGKPHTEQDQIGKKWSSNASCVSARGAKLSGRSLEPFSNERPRGMTVSGGNAVQNSAYRSDITCGPWSAKACQGLSVFQVEILRAAALRISGRKKLLP